MVCGYGVQKKPPDIHRMLRQQFFKHILIGVAIVWERPGVGNANLSNPGERLVVPR